MDSYADEKDFELLENDKYTFSILNTVLKTDCDLIRTDHSTFILCHSMLPYPVWLWTVDGCTEETKEKAWELVAEYRPLTSGYRFNVKYELADYFIEKGRQENLNVGMTVELFAYDCPSPVSPEIKADGCIYCCTEEDKAKTAELIFTFYTDIGEDNLTYEQCIEKAEEYISRQAFFIWKNEAGDTVACCSFNYSDGLATIGCVYTFPQYRRMHYAQNLVYMVTKMLRDKGDMPMLYTDANYCASNACYEKIGYVLRGRLCTIAVK